MKILLISYGDIGFDGRLRSLINVFSQMGEVYAFSRGSVPLNEISKICNLPYTKFIGEAIRFAKKIDKIDWLVLDNRKATIPGLLIKKKYKPNIVIQDCRELYLINEVKHLTGKIGCVFEKMMVKRSDIVICANQERCEIMQREYKLDKTPISYENLRKLEFESDEALGLAKKKLDPFIIEDEIRILSSSGCSIKRTNDVLVRNLNKVQEKCRLFLVGDSTSDEKQAIESIVEEMKVDNVEILGRLNQTELKYLISHCHIGIVNYGQYDTNNRLCASGKLYEFLYEGIPVVTTTNPPLKRICETYNVGVCDDEYYNGINTVLGDYDSYILAIKKYTENFTVEMNDDKLIKDINVRISRAVN